MGPDFEKDLHLRLGEKNTFIIVEDETPMVFIDEYEDTYFLRVEYPDFRFVCFLPDNVDVAAGQVKEFLDELSST